MSQDHYIAELLARIEQLKKERDEAAGLNPGGYDYFAGRVAEAEKRVANAIYVAEQLRAELAAREAITWHDAAAELPDDETTVLVCSPDGSEPVWPGFHDERGWHWIESTEQCIAVTYWAEMPVGVNTELGRAERRP